MAQPVDHTGCPFGLFERQFGQHLCTGDVKRFVFEQIIGRLAGGQDTGQGFVEFMHNARRQFGQGVQASDLAQMQELVGTQAVVPLAQHYEAVALAGFSPAEVEKLRAMLRRLYENAAPLL